MKAFQIVPFAENFLLSAEFWNCIPNTLQRQLFQNYFLCLLYLEICSVMEENRILNLFLTI